MSTVRMLPAKDRSVSSAPYAGTGPITEYRIAGNPGLVLVVAKPNLSGDSRRTWRCYYSITENGRRHRRKVRLGLYPATTFADARASAARLMSDVDHGSDPFAETKKRIQVAERAQLTFTDLVEDYLEDRRCLVSIAEIERELRKDVLPMVGNRRPADITPADIDRVASALLLPGRDSKVMARRIVVRLKALYSYALLDAPSLAEKYAIVTNPAANIGRRRPGTEGKFGRPKPRTRVMTDDEIICFWKALDGSDMRPETRQTLKLVLVTAQRPGEVRQARKTDIRLSSETPHWTIPADHAKNGRSHVVPLSPLAGSLIKEAAERNPVSGLLFPGPRQAEAAADNVVLPTAMANLFRNHLPNSDPATPHDLRRTAATGMRAIGISRDVVSLVLNHASVGVTAQHYDHHDALVERREALLRWGAHIEALLAK